MNPQSGSFLSTNFRRADQNSPGYGYGTLETQSVGLADEDGLVHVSPDGSTKLIVPLTKIINNVDVDTSNDQHYIHHVLFAPNGEQFVFLHRWLKDDIRYTQLYLSDISGDCELLLEDKYVSHFCWLDSEHLFLWGRSGEYGRGYHIINVNSGTKTYIDSLAGYGDGHPSVSPDGKWIVTDTYPDRARRRHLTLYNLETGNLINLGTFLAPFGFDGPTRCDLHPRWSHNGQLISIDSTHTGTRRSYIIDVSQIVS